MEAETSCSRGSWAATAAWKCPPSPPSPLWDLYDTFFGRFRVALGCLESLGYLTAGWQQQWQWRQLRQWQPWQPSNWPGKRLDSMLMQKMQTAPSLVLPSDFLKIESETPIVTWGLKIRTETGDGYRYGGWRGGRLTMNWLFWSPRVVSPPPQCMGGHLPLDCVFVIVIPIPLCCSLFAILSSPLGRSYARGTITIAINISVNLAGLFIGPLTG